MSIEKGTATLFHTEGKPYTSISVGTVDLIKNPDALAIWVFLQTKSNDWNVIGSFLQDHFSIGKVRYQTAMKYLKDIGLIYYTTTNNPKTGKLSGRKITVRYEIPNVQKTACSGIENEQSEHTENNTFGELPNIQETDSSLNRQFVKQPTTNKGSITNNECIDINNPIIPKIDLEIDEEIIFNHWKEVMNHPNAKFDKKRKQRIKARIKDGFSAGELCRAITGASYDDWIMGRSSNSTKKYDGIETVLRDVAQVEKFIALYDKGNSQERYSNITANNINILDSL
ncbi:TPA: hypothetical protein JRS25_004116 [Escherichia coli]|nr:hypothetical protein [Escherichia coli]